MGEADNPLDQPDVGIEGSADAGADFDEAALEADINALDDTTSEEQPAEQPDGQQEQWTPEQKKVYLQATKKYSDQLKDANTRMAQLESEAAAAKARAELLQQQSEQAMQRQSQKPEEPGEPVDPAVAKRLEAMFKQTPLYQELMQTRQVLRETMAARPEAYLDESEIPPDVVQEIAPKFRSAVGRLDNPTPEVLRTVAARLAAPVMAKQIAANKAEKAQAAKARESKRQQMQRAQTGASGGMQSGGKAFSDMSVTEQEKALEGMFSGKSLETLSDEFS